MTKPAQPKTPTPPPRSWLQKYWWIAPFTIVSLSIVTLCAMVIGSRLSPKAKPVVVCTGENATDFKCWSKHYQQLVAYRSPAAAFADAKAEYAKGTYIKTNCHQISHVIGRASALRYPNVVEAYNRGDNFCWSGYYHGVMETIATKLGVDKVIATAPSICDDAKGKKGQYSFYHYNCVHGLGHGVMAVKDNQLFEALKVCDRFSDSWEQSSCYGGVFMENIMSEVNPDHKTVYLKRDDPLYPCTAVDQKYKRDCYMMQTSHALITVDQDFDKVFALCSSVESPYDTTCYQSLGRDASGHTISQVAPTVALCNKGTTQLARTNCYRGAVKDFISYFHKLEPGIELCNAITEQPTRDECTSTAKDYIKTF